MYYSISDIDQFTRFFSTNVLQEYFVPYEKSTEFFHEMKKVLIKCGLKIINLSIRYFPPVDDNNRILLDYRSHSQYGTVAFVLFLNIYHYELDRANKMARELIDIAIKYNGKFYLPYQRFATRHQIKSCYDIRLFKSYKRKLDPNNKFTSDFLKYLCQ